MQIGVVGLGRMGGNIARRLMQNGHEAVVYDRDATATKALSGEGALGAGGLKSSCGSSEAARRVADVARRRHHRRRGARAR